jgi:hypothetical protein
MSSALEKFVQTLDGLNFQTWKHQFKAFLQSQDLWGVINRTTLRPVAADLANPTDVELTSMLQWDTLSDRALGNLVLRLTPPVYQTVEQMNAPDAWDELHCIYGAISPS